MEATESTSPEQQGVALAHALANVSLDPTRYRVLSQHDSPLKCRIADKDLVQLARDAGQAIKAVKDAETEKERVVKEAKGVVAEAEGFVNTLLEKLETGEEVRQVMVQEIADLVDGVVRSVRTDTGETLSSRAISAHERQLELQADTAQSLGGENQDAEEELVDLEADEELSDDERRVAHQFKHRTPADGAA